MGPNKKNERKSRLIQRLSGYVRQTASETPFFRHFSFENIGQIRDGKEPHGAFYKFILKVGKIGILLGRTTSMLFSARCDKGESWKVAHRFANGSLFFVVLSMAFVGMIMVYQSTEQLSRTIGDTTLVGASFFKLLVRVLGPTVIGMLIACRVGAGIAAEIAAMKVTDQLDAMRLCGADPVETLMVPRLRGGIIAGLTLTAAGCLASVLSGMYTGILWFNMNPTTYLNFSLVDNADIVQGLVKSFVYGIAVPIVSGASGLAAYGGARGVGRATTDAVVSASFAIVLLDSLISFVAYLLGGQ